MFQPLRAAALSAALFSVTAFIAPANATPIIPVFDEFGDLPVATFGGSGIPTDPTAITFLTDDDTGFTATLGLSATPRFGNEPLTAVDGVYTAQTGSNDGTPGNPGSQSTWNFNFFIAVDTLTPFSIAELGLRFLYDLDPGVGTPEAELGVPWRRIP